MKSSLNRVQKRSLDMWNIEDFMVSTKFHEIHTEQSTKQISRDVKYWGFHDIHQISWNPHQTEYKTAVKFGVFYEILTKQSTKQIFRDVKYWGFHDIHQISWNPHQAVYKKAVKYVEFMKSSPNRVLEMWNMPDFMKSALNRVQNSCEICSISWNPPNFIWNLLDFMKSRPYWTIKLKL